MCGRTPPHLHRPTGGHEVPDRLGPGEKGWGQELLEEPGASLGVLRERQPECRVAPRSCLCLAQPPLLPAPRLSHETKLCGQMVLMVQGPRRNPPRQAGQRVLCIDFLGLQGMGWPSLGEGRGWGKALLEGRGAEGRGAWPSWPLKGRPS